MGSFDQNGEGFGKAPGRKKRMSGNDTDARQGVEELLGTEFGGGRGQGDTDGPWRVDRMNVKVEGPSGWMGRGWGLRRLSRETGSGSAQGPTSRRGRSWRTSSRSEASGVKARRLPTAQGEEQTLKGNGAGEGGCTLEDRGTSAGKPRTG